MSDSQETENKKMKNILNFDIQSKVVEYQILSEQQNNRFFEFKNTLLGNYSSKLFLKNKIEPTKKI